MKENNSPLENLKDEYEMLLLRDRIQQNKRIKRLCNKTFIKHKIKVMTQEEKQLLLKDLCARLPYGVKVQHQHQDYLEEVQTVEHISRKYGEIETNSVLGFVDDFKPYLRPLSSMTEEESKELQKITNNNFYASSNYISNSNSSLDGEWRSSYNNFVTNDICNKLISWLDKNHFDHRTDEEGKTLIEKGLAIPVTKENNPYKTLKV